MRVTPCACAPAFPNDWPGFHLRYRLPDSEAVYEIEVRNPEGQAKRVAAVDIDERPGRIEYGAACIPLFRDGLVHQVRVTLTGTVENGMTGRQENSG